MSEKNEGKDTIFVRNKLIRLRGELHELKQAWVMGILNLTPDSFFKKSRYEDVSAALHETERMIRDGARMIDIGASSSRPGAASISAQKEIERLKPFLTRARQEFPEVYFSVDTYYSEVARAAADQGADMINDISGGMLDEEMPRTMGDLQLPYVMMHMKGTPVTMKNLAHYDSVFKDIILFFSRQLARFRAFGVHDILLDPGFGFAKNLAQNYELLQKLDQFEMMRCPLLVGVSRKSMISRLLETDPENALNGTTAVHTLALQKGASILRVHDVREAVEAVKILTFTQKFA